GAIAPVAAALVPCGLIQNPFGGRKSMTEAPLFPEQGRLAGMDFGTVRIGIAVCDPDRILASPLATYSRQNAIADGEYFRDLVASERVAGFVVGLPVHMSGDESEKSRQARQFGQWLGEVTTLP